MIEKPKINRDPIQIKRALISVYDKTDIFDLAKVLHDNQIEILSTGGTSIALRENNIPVQDVSDYTNFPEIMDGRVKTINPLVEGGILGLRDIHEDDAKSNSIKWIDLVICNLYPFSETINRTNCDLPLALENIDIGGPTMIRSAAKNLGWVCVLVDPSDYKSISSELNKSGTISFSTREKLASKAFGHTAEYDTMIYNYLHSESLPNILNLSYTKHSHLRYGENPHQSAASYTVYGNSDNNILNATIHQGKKLSYNNIMDADSALACVREFHKPTCVIVKHSNPCGVAIGKNLLEAYNNAFNADSISAFGGIVALNKQCTADVAEAIINVFAEIVLAPSFDDDALKIFSKKQNLRILSIGNLNVRKPKIEVRNIDGGLLAQDTDIKNLTENDLQVVTQAQPSKSDIKTALFTWKVLRHAKSNGILIAKDNITVGLGAGQVSRVDAVSMALQKGGKNVAGGVLASDAFFPFRDSIDSLKDSGISAIIQPGGSIRDKEVIDACDEYNISMMFTGVRCFKH